MESLATAAISNQVARATLAAIKFEALTNRQCVQLEALRQEVVYPTLMSLAPASQAHALIQCAVPLRCWLQNCNSASKTCSTVGRFVSMNLP
jgi:hypothetical protein